MIKIRRCSTVLLFLLFLNNTADCQIVIKDRELFGSGVVCTLVGLIGSGLVYKYGKEWIQDFGKIHELKKTINQKGAKIVHWVETRGQFGGYTIEDKTTLKIPNTISARIRQEIQNHWQQLCRTESDQRMTEYILFCSFCAAILTLIGPPMMYDSIKGTSK